MTLSRRGLLSVALLFVLVAPAATQSQERWVGTWATAVVARPVAPAAPAAPNTPPPVHVNNQTLRQIVHVSLGGSRVRVVFSNAFGTAPLAIGAAHVALRAKDAAIVPGSGRPLTFGGRAASQVPPGAVLVSDPVTLAVPAFADLAIDAYLPGNTADGTSPLTVHNGAFQTNYLSQTGNHAGAPELPMASTMRAWFFLARVEVTPAGPASAVVTFGDSLTDGTASTVDTNNRWPDHLARRLSKQPDARVGVLNMGIAGNRLLTDGAGVNALARFDRDVLAQPGATHVIVLEGINDLGIPREGPVPTTDDLIAAHQQLIARARAKGLRIYGATMLPFEGTNLGGIANGYYTPEKDARRRAFNQWLRTSGAYDAVIDFEAAVRDPENPARLSPKFKAPDNLHLNDAGYEALANAVDLALLRR
jgi:lysophospholipase L1-like esterase